MRNHVFEVRFSKSHAHVVSCLCEIYIYQFALITKMCQTSEYIQLSLLSFYKSNAKIAKVARELFSVEGIKIDRKTVAKYYKRFK